MLISQRQCVRFPQVLSLASRGFGFERRGETKPSERFRFAADLQGANLCSVIKNFFESGRMRHFGDEKAASGALT
jgi:hypothetical protein